MKKLLVALGLMPLMAMAYTEVIDGVTWNYFIQDGRASVGSYSPRAVATSTTGAIIIPSNLGGCPVTSIGPAAFGGCSGLTSVTIPSSVTSIGRAAFDKCSGLTSVVIPYGVTSIRDDTFLGCSGLTSVTIPSSVTTIEEYAFYGCSNLTSVIIPPSVTYIGASAFAYCSGLQDVKIMSKTFIGVSAFARCNGLKDVTIPSCEVRLLTTFPDSQIEKAVVCEGATIIGDEAFRDCTNLISVTMPSSVTNIGVHAFDGCRELTSVTIPAAVTDIGSCAFFKCGRMMSINVEGDNRVYSSADGMLYDKTQRELIACPGGKTGIVVIPSGVTEIGAYAFGGCSGLTAVTIPSSVTSIGMSAFSGCSGMTSMTLPFIGARRGNSGSADALFGYIFGTTWYVGSNRTDQYYSRSSHITYDIPSSLESVVITDETMIGYGAFYNCSGLTSVKFPSNVAQICENAFYGCDGLGDGIITVDGWVVCINGNLALAEIPNGVKRIADGAFAGNKKLTFLKVPTSLDQIGVGGFAGCDGLSGVSINDVAAWCGIEFASPTANPLYYAKKLYVDEREQIYLDIPNGVEEIGQYAFYNCSRFMSVTVPSSVMSVEKDAFSGCSGLTAVNISDLFAWCEIDFASETANPLFYAGKLQLEGVEIVDLEVPEGVGEIGDYAFCNCADFKSVTIPSSVTNIGQFAFCGCKGLKDMTIPSTVISIGVDAFRGCDINDVTMPGRFAIKDVFPSSHSKIQDVTILDGEEVLLKDVFAGCSALTTVVISEGVTTLGEDLFYNLGNLKELTVPSTVTSIGGYALYGCTSLEVIHVSNDGDIEALKQMLYESGFDAEGVTFDHEVSPISPEQPIEVPSALVDEAQTYVDVARGEVAPYESAAAVYDGMLLGEDGAVRGTIQVKVAKMRSGTAKVTATVQMTGGMKKISFKSGVADEKGTVTGLMAAGGHELSIALGVNGLGGSFRRAGDGVTYLVDGARNLFTAKDDSSRAAAAAIEEKWIGAINVAGDGVGLTISIAKKGKVKVSGTVVGVKVSATSQLLVGKDCCCVPVVITKKASLAFNLWLMGNGSVTIRGIASSGTGDETSIPHLWAGKPNTLKEGARFRIEDETKRKLSDWFVLLYEEYLPNELMVAQNGAKWIVAAGAKAGKVVFVSGTTMIDTSKTGENPSGLKLTYKAKDGSFKGAFKVYAMDFSSKRTKVKPYTVNVTGVMVGERGYGTATIKNPFLSFPITIE